MTREKASARPPRIIVLMVLPSMYRITKAASAEIGMDSKHRAGGPHAAEKQQNHQAGQHQADKPFVQHRVNACLTKTD